MNLPSGGRSSRDAGAGGSFGRPVRSASRSGVAGAPPSIPVGNDFRFSKTQKNLPSGGRSSRDAGAGGLLRAPGEIRLPLRRRRSSALHSDRKRFSFFKGPYPNR